MLLNSNSYFDSSDLLEPGLTVSPEIMAGRRFCPPEWDQFFTGLAAAEAAAEAQCRLISESFGKLGLRDLESRYAILALEEADHFRLVEGLISKKTELPKKTEHILGGSKFTKLKDKEMLLLRLMVVHSAFEPAALSILGFLMNHGDELFEHSFSLKIKRAFKKILVDEVSHVYEGAALIKKLIENKIVPVPSENVCRIVSEHIAYVKLSIPYFFRKIPGKKIPDKKLVEDFLFYSNKSGEVYESKFRTGR